MDEPRVEVVDIIVDCADPELVAAFWADLLARPIEGRKGPYVWLERRNGMGLGFQRVNEPKIAKNRVHLDVAAPDAAETQATVVALGGSRVSGYEAGGFLVMADPEGNEFCVLPAEPFAFDDEGNTDYLTK